MPSIYNISGLFEDLDETINIINIHMWLSIWSIYIYDTKKMYNILFSCMGYIELLWSDSRGFRQILAICVWMRSFLGRNLWRHQDAHSTRILVINNTHSMYTIASIHAFSVHETSIHTQTHTHSNDDRWLPDLALTVSRRRSQNSMSKKHCTHCNKKSIT